MFISFETGKGYRVKGLSFHPKRPWILATLHNGLIQLWDYRMGTRIDVFDEHEGPVRGVDFHIKEPMFVSGGDDQKIKVWDYKQRRCIFTLLGHLDYVRTVEFHRELPWICSASDDQTVRIWSWKTRQCLSILTGHHHYVMCARFHKKDDLIVSVSLDSTVRVWDIAGVRKKHAAGTGAAGAGGAAASAGAAANPFSDRLGGLQSDFGATSDMFGNTDAVVRYVLEGHERGVNWAAFHPTLPMIISAADDRYIKIWRYNDIKAWDVDTMRGHYHNVSCVLFHPRADLVISDSEDKSIRVWDLSKRQSILTFKRDLDRFWILAGHPTQSLFAAGHDTGLIVFKLQRERPVFASHGDTLYFINDTYIRSYHFPSGRDIPLLQFRRHVPALDPNPPRSMSFSPAENTILICSDAEGGSYELRHIPSDPSRADAATADVKRGLGASAVFVARNRFAVLDKAGLLIVKDFKNTVTKRISLPLAANKLFAAPTGQVLLRSEDAVVLFDLQQKKCLGEAAVNNIKMVEWSHDMRYVALLGKHAVMICDRNLEVLAQTPETMHLKSAAWDDKGVLIYSTVNHLKYVLPNGDSGIIRTLDVPIYLSRVNGSTVWCMDREVRNRVMGIDTTEYLFKLALSQRRFNDVMRMIKNTRLCGQSIIAYLQQKGYPEIALHFVKDDATRFSLAIESGNVDAAQTAAQKLDKPKCWHKLGVGALKQGNLDVAETAYQRTKDFDRLAFLYMLTGNTDKLETMRRIAEMRGDVMSRFQTALFLGDVEERVRVLEEVGQVALAYVTAATHNLREAMERTAARLTEKGVDPASLPTPLPSAKLLTPPQPILRHDNWPLLNVAQSFVPGVDDDDDAAIAGGDGGIDVAMQGGWGDDLDLGDLPGGQPAAAPGDSADPLAADPLADGEGDGWADALDIPDLPVVPVAAAASDDIFVAPTPGTTYDEVWVNNSNLAADHAAAGSYDTAMQLLHRQIGAVCFEPLRSAMLACHHAAHGSMPVMVGAPPLATALHRNAVDAAPPGYLPVNCVTLDLIAERIKAAYLATTGGKFSEAMTHFMFALHHIPLTVVHQRQHINDVKDLVTVCREYVTGLRLELMRKDVAKSDPVRATELAAYFTHCALKPLHLASTLRLAMGCGYKLGNFGDTATFCRRLLELNPAPAVATQAKQVLQVCESKKTNAHKLKYDARNPFVVCGIDLVPVYRGSPLVHCPYCGAPFQPQHKGKQCPTCQIAEIGAPASGLTVSSLPTRG